MPNSMSIKRGARYKEWTLFQTERGKNGSHIKVSIELFTILHLHTEDVFV